MKTGTMLQPSSLCYAVPSLKRRFMKHFVSCTPPACQAHKSMKHICACELCSSSIKIYEARLSAYEAKPFQASYFFARNSGKKMGCKLLFPHLVFLEKVQISFMQIQLTANLRFYYLLPQKQVQLITSAPDIEITAG